MASEDNSESMVEDTIGNMKRQLSNYKRYFRGEVTKVKLLLDKGEARVANTVQIRMVRLQNIFEKYISMVEALAEEGEREDDEMLEEYYYQMLAQVTSTIAAVETSTSNSNQVSHSLDNMKLPPINLPSFSGKYGEWAPFFDTFTSLIHSNNVISKIQKFHYLKAALKGDAAQVIASLEISSSNYDAAWESLKRRYDNKRLIMENHMKSLLAIPTVSKESFTSLRALLDQSSQHLQSLEALNRPPESKFDDLIVHIIADKLDSASRRSWESSIKQNEFPDWNRLKTFLTEKCNVLEMENLSLNKAERSERAVKGFHKHNSLIAASNRNMKRFRCGYCEQEHLIMNCERFKQLSIQNRIKEARNKKLCINCLRAGHAVSTCTSRACLKCEKRHHTLLHLNDVFSSHSENGMLSQNADANMPVSAINSSNSFIDSSNSGPSANCVHPVNSSQVLLSTCLIQIRDATGHYQQAKALLDSGSQVNLISSNLAKRLRLPTSNINMPITGIGQSTTSVTQFITAKIKSRINHYEEQLRFLIVPVITGKIPPFSLPAGNLGTPKNLPLADPSFHIPSEIDVLIGAELFYNLLCVGRITINNLLYQKTLLGWVVAGQVGRTMNVKISQSVLCNQASISNETSALNTTLKKFWELENSHCSIFPITTPEEAQCEKHFISNVHRLSSGRFCVALPWKRSPTKLSSSREQALRRFYSLERKLLKNTNLKEQYSSFINEYISLRHMKLANDQLAEDGYFLPHHAVTKETSVTTKLRVVFDASAKTPSGYSLNDCLMVGPVIQDDLFSILLRFRFYKIALTADIEKMYRQIALSNDDCKYHKILWRENPDESIRVYELQTVTYGVAPSSFLATRSLQELARQEYHLFPEAADIVLNDFYVDDLLTGADDVETAIRLQVDLSKLLAKGGMHLRKWGSNNRQVLASVENIDESDTTVISWDKADQLKMLGVQWDPKTDSIQYHVNAREVTRLSKRIILAQIAQIFDPLGLLGPIIILMKFLLQRLWQLKLNWDESVPQDIHDTFQSILTNLRDVSFSIPRYVLNDCNLTYELHGFSDASEKGYGACIYIRSISPEGVIASNLLCSKSKVAPLKSITLPRLELCAAVMLAQLQDKVIKGGCIKYKNTRLYTDSTIVLAWIQSSSKRWKTFVANRVGEIHQLTAVNNWHHVSTSQNPADLISRGCKPSDLSTCSLWWNGPACLSQMSFSPSNDLFESNLEAKGPEIHSLHVHPEIDIVKKFSCYHKLLRITALCLRFIYNLRNGSSRVTGYVTFPELRKANLRLISIVQRHSFPTEIRCLQGHSSVPPNSKLRNLNPFYDASDAVIRVGGRLRHAMVAYSTKFPLVLPANHVFTELLINAVHRDNLHSATQSTLAATRQSYWILNGRSTIRKAIRKCITCFKANPQPGFPMMGDLPANRIQPTCRPFLKSGIDYCGPFVIKDGSRRSKKTKKIYVAIFVCFVTKAIHIEMVTELSSAAFIATLNRFIARRGLVTDLFSDNGTNFTGANTELKILLKQFQRENTLCDAMAIKGVNWHFIPPRAPHFGGLWEAAVKSAKHHLKRVAANSCLTYEEMHTLLCQIEAILNSRPLCPLSSDPNDELALTPGHFLIGDALTAIPEPSLVQIPANRLSRWQMIQLLKQHFWARWHKEYLHECQRRNKWSSSSGTAIQVGQLVIVREDNMPPSHWPLGRVVDVHPGEDGVVRAATIRLGKTVLKRSATRLCVLPLDNS